MSDENKLLHQRLRRKKGSAVEHACIDCGGPAFEWAYQHSDPNPAYDEIGSPYSLDFEHYAPMCRSDHRKLDAKMNPTNTARLVAQLTAVFPGSEEMARRSALAKKVGRPLEKVEAQALGHRGGTARAKRMKVDPELRERLAAVSRATALKVAKVRRVCVCGVESTPTGIGNHQKSTGHVGHTDRKD